MPIAEYREGDRWFVRAYLPDAHLNEEVTVTLRGTEAWLRIRRRVDCPGCDCAVAHHVTFEKVVRIPAGTAPEDVTAHYGDGVLIVSWPVASPR
jgi:HSP20 family molecular chaperone IbpA